MVDKKQLTFTSGNGHTGKIVWWFSDSGTWMWEALGNSGEEATEKLALEKARYWIREGLDQARSAKILDEVDN